MTSLTFSPVISRLTAVLYVNLRDLKLYFALSPNAIDFSICDAVSSFQINDFTDGKVFEEGRIVAFSAGELNEKGFGKDFRNNWYGKKS